MEQYKNEFLKTFDPHIVEEYKDKIFTTNEQQYTYLNREPEKYRGENACYCYINKYLSIGQKITLRVNKTDYKEFTYLNAIKNEYSSNYTIVKSDDHILYPLFGMYLHILLEFTDGNLDLIKNKIKITHDFQKKYRNNVVYFKTVINSIEWNIDLNTLIFNLKPTSGDVIFWSYNYYKICDGLNRNNFIDTFTSINKYYFNVDGISFKQLRGKKMIIDYETGQKNKILRNLYYCLAMRFLLGTYISLYDEFISDIKCKIWKAISNSDLYESDLYYAFIDQFGCDINEIENNEDLKGKASGFARRRYII